MGLLNNSSVYLVGAVDCHEDPMRWRKEISSNLLEPLGIKVYNPLIKPKWFNDNFNIDNIDDEIKEFKRIINNDIQLDVEKRMFAVRKLCLRMASDANFIIASIPKKFTVGTFEELSIAANVGKPILIYMPDGIDISTWIPVQLFDNLKSFKEHTFTSMDDLYNYVKMVDSGDIKVDNIQWLFISYHNNI